MRIAKLLAAAVLVACSGITGNNRGTVSFNFSTACAYQGIVFDFYADLVPLGTRTVSAGDRVSFAVSTGVHSFRTIRHTGNVQELDWTAISVNAGATTDLPITCGL